MYATYEQLMEEKLAQISDKRDKRQGSIIFDALAPNAAETASFYTDLAMLENRTYGDTAIGEDLSRRCAERGVFRKQPTKATFLGRFLDKKGKGVAVPVGSRYHLETLNYVVVKPAAKDGEWIVECETPGIVGNSYLGTLLPIEYVENLAEAELAELLTDGEDQEEDEELRKRYIASFDTDAFGGNISDYKRKVNAIYGVGGVKVYPVWNGGGTVKLSIIDSGYRAPTVTETAKIQLEIDPGKQGLGTGIAPIGHKVTVIPVTETVCTISMEVTLKTDTQGAVVMEELKKTFEEYFLGLRKQWAETETMIVRLSYLESRALNCNGVIDVQKTKINGQMQNLALNGDAIPILGEVEAVWK